ncbi:VOC family protein [Halobacillus sp. ACCC02827]|uniref:VOC family protein n=1 Tax=Halobacillus sp. ACCC02827 TaxID=3052090 RepID=UPI002570278C|nr:VOC family protein [Halobacillus sp. ACCC02827]WJE14255.1 VOC family protein [Halobacillus sp. ACCC02827]
MAGHASEELSKGDKKSTTDIKKDGAILPEIGTVFIPVQDIRQGAMWYSRLLAVPYKEEFPHNHLYILPLSGVNIVLDSKRYNQESIYINPVFHLNTNDIHEAYLQVQEMEAGWIGSIEHGHYFSFQDPDGNMLMICQC